MERDLAMTSTKRGMRSSEVMDASPRDDAADDSMCRWMPATSCFCISSSASTLSTGVAAVSTLSSARAA